MVQSVRATYMDGVLKPSESLDLEDGDVVTLSISIDEIADDGVAIESASADGNGEVEGAEPAEAQRKGPTDGPALLERISRITASVPDSEWEKLPKDGARNKKHYLYGHPKEDEE